MWSMFRRYVLELSIPLQKLIQKLHPTEATVSYVTVRDLIPKLKTGDILISNESWHLSNLLISGRYNHAAVYDGYRVIEAIACGVVATDAVDWFMRKNEFAVLRPAHIEHDQEVNMRIFLWSCLGHPYDLMFGSIEADKSFYCSELAWMAWESCSDWTKSFTRKQVLGIDTILAQDFYDAVASDKLELIFEFQQQP